MVILSLPTLLTRNDHGPKSNNDFTAVFCHTNLHTGKVVVDKANKGQENKWGSPLLITVAVPSEVLLLLLNKHAASACSLENLPAPFDISVGL